MTFVLGIFAGLVMPMQTSINTRLRKSLGTPYRASLVNFLVGLVLLVLLALLMGRGLPSATLLRTAPWWMFLGGLCGVTVITANLLLFPVLGSIQTVIFPVFGQILGGLAIDTFGWLRVTKVPLTPWRIVGAALVLAGVLLVALGGKQPSSGNSEKNGASLWVYRLLGFLSGCVGAVQVSVNGNLGVVLGSKVHASIVNFVVGALVLLLICVCRYPREEKGTFTTEGPAWMWTGGLLGGLFVLLNVYLQQTLGTGMTVILNLTGLTAGGLLVDQTGILDSPKRPVTLQKILGVFVMLVGAGMTKLL